VQAAPLLRDTMTNTPRFIGPSLVFVGYGATSGTGSGFGIRRVATFPIDVIGPAVVGNSYPAPDNLPPELFYYLDAQTMNRNTCSGDSGGPSFFVEHGVEWLAGVTSSGDADCLIDGANQRSDLPYVTDFIQPHLDVFEADNPCRADGACDETCDQDGQVGDPDCAALHCAADGVCAEPAPRRAILTAPPPPPATAATTASAIRPVPPTPTACASAAPRATASTAAPRPIPTVRRARSRPTPARPRPTPPIPATALTATRPAAAAAPALRRPAPPRPCCCSPSVRCSAAGDRPREQREQGLPVARGRRGVVDRRVGRHPAVAGLVALDDVIDASAGERVVEHLPLGVGERRVVHRAADVDAGTDLSDQAVRAVLGVGDDVAGMVRGRGGDAIGVGRRRDQREAAAHAVAGEGDLGGAEVIEVGADVAHEAGGGGAGVARSHAARTAGSENSAVGSGAVYSPRR